MKNRIEELRIVKKTRQEELARLMGVSRQTISSLENGRYDPSIFLAYKIAKYFGGKDNYLKAVKDLAKCIYEVA